jgi:hypothetical protein
MSLILDCTAFKRYNHPGETEEMGIKFNSNVTKHLLTRQGWKMSVGPLVTYFILAT